MEQGARAAVYQQIRCDRKRRPATTQRRCRGSSARKPDGSESAVAGSYSTTSAAASCAVFQYRLRAGPSYLPQKPPGHSRLFRRLEGRSDGWRFPRSGDAKQPLFHGRRHLVRTVPGESWLTPHNRTLVDFAAAYGEVTQSNTPTIKTNIIHGGVERDEYLHPRLYIFGSGAWDHNFSQGLDLQQAYGGGLGWTAYKSDTADLNLRAGVSYIRQQFTNSAFNKNLFGSTFGET
ncbi:MAG: DUF481 domain-containing protein, partial [Acidobacteriaceae bacterium]|nr:DUF481 domain-containing protein [Acidobacteriaceae bacterium]